MAVGTPSIDSAVALDLQQLIQLLRSTAGELLKAVDAVKPSNSDGYVTITDTLKGLSSLYAQLTAVSKSSIMDKEGDAWFRRVVQGAVDTLVTARNAAYKFILTANEEQEAKRPELEGVFESTVAYLERFKLRIGVHVSTADLQVSNGPEAPATEPVDHREVMLKQLRHFGEKSLLLGDPIRAIATLMVGTDGQKRSLDKLTQMAKAGHVSELVESGAVSALCRFIQAGGEVPASLLSLLAGEAGENVEVFRRCGGEGVVKLVESAREQESGPVAPATPVPQGK